MARKKTEKERQLYTLIEALDAQTDDKGELGSLISYVILTSLIDFETNTGSEEERRFEEIKAIYTGLEKAIERSREEDSYSVLCELTTQKAKELKQILDKERKIENETLLKLIINSLTHQKNYEDTLKRKGLRLRDNVYDTGILYGRRNILRKNYEAIRDIFQS
ncbi:MAG TPA: hypothetical protein ENF94_02055 [Candidatus Woesearchaeota archaeon]|nr:MAG: hypothetical protein DRJ25_01290 [Candidatus Woesearchaeota archaeon]HDD70926.1 hypothetical protein [Candidatus Woesearchaeota archaeon]